jgi:hypothetical protein
LNANNYRYLLCTFQSFMDLPLIEMPGNMPNMLIIHQKSEYCKSNVFKSQFKSD